MKTPWYETSGGALQALLATRSFQYCTLYTFFLANGLGTIRTAVADNNISIPGYTWPKNSPPIDPKDRRSSGHWKAGLDVDTWQCMVMPRLVDPVLGTVTPDKIGTQPWLAAASAGALDGCEVQVDRAYFPTWSGWPAPVAVTGVVTIFYGRMAAVDVWRTNLILSVNSHLELLNQAMPGNLFQTNCRFTLFSPGCTLSKAAFVKAGSIVAVPTDNTFTSSVTAPSGSGTFIQGTVVMTSGANVGFQRTITNWVAGAPGTFTLIAPFPFDLTPGDTFNAYPGCDKQMPTCILFGNLPNYGGQPYIPDALTAI